MDARTKQYAANWALWQAASAGDATDVKNLLTAPDRRPDGEAVVARLAQRGTRITWNELPIADTTWTMANGETPLMVATRQKSDHVARVPWFRWPWSPPEPTKNYQEVIDLISKVQPGDAAVAVPAPEDVPDDTPPPSTVTAPAPPRAPSSSDDDEYSSDEEGHRGGRRQLRRRQSRRRQSRRRQSRRQQSRRQQSRRQQSRRQQSHKIKHNE